MFWRHRIDVGSCYEKFRETGDLEALKKGVIDVIKASDAYKEYTDDFDVYCQGLKDAEDVDHWDEAYDDLIDFCDEKAVWLNTL